MPFGQTSDVHTEEYWSDHFTNFITPAIEKAADGKKILEYQAMIANPAGGAISEEVFNHLYKADIVLAELTDFSPNVMYELGIRHCLQERTILILEKNQAIPFYFTDYKVIKYSTTSNKEIQSFSDEIQRRLIELSQRAHGPRPSDNPVASYFRGTDKKLLVVSTDHQRVNMYESTFSNLYIPTTNDKRNARKKEAMREAQQRIRLLASSGHAYLVMYGSPFGSILMERLEAGIPVQIILTNPWTENKVQLTLRELAEQFPFIDSKQRPAIEKTLQGDFTELDPVELIEKSRHYQNKYLPSIRGYEDLQKPDANNIELHIYSPPIAETILLTETCGFFEPYLHINLQERRRHHMNTFEVEFPNSSYFYKNCTEYFDSLWSSSIPYSQFVEEEGLFKEQLRGKYAKKTHPPDSTA